MVNVLSRRQILALLEEERQLILKRDMEEHGIKEMMPWNHHIRWYLEISKQWAIHHLTEVFRLPPGRLLDVGAYWGLIAGAAYRQGWRISAVDAYPAPLCSSLRIPGRNVELGLYNACVDELSYPENTFEVVILSEVLEHLLYSPVPMFKEICRVLKPGGMVLISTPNPAGMGKLLRLAFGANPLEPHINTFLEDPKAFTYKGYTFFGNNREAKLWTRGELKIVLPMCGLEVAKDFSYGNTVVLERSTTRERFTIPVSRMLLPLIKCFSIAGGSNFVIGRKPVST